MPLDECCSTCATCGTRCCLEGWPPNTCLHGMAVCDVCRPGDCAECAEEIAREVAA